MGTRKRRKFSDEFKAEAVRLVDESEKSVGQIARDLDLRSRRCAAGSSRRPSKPATARRARSRVPSARNWCSCRGRPRSCAWSGRSQKSDGLLRQGTRMRFECIAEEKAGFPVTTLCRVLQVSPS